MTARTPDDVLDDVDELLAKLYGARIMATQEMVAKGDFKKASRRAGEAGGYRLVRKMLEEYRETGKIPKPVANDNWEAYGGVATAVESVNDALVADQDDDDDSDIFPGVQ